MAVGTKRRSLRPTRVFSILVIISLIYFVSRHITVTWDSSTSAPFLDLFDSVTNQLPQQPSLPQQSFTQPNQPGLVENAHQLSDPDSFLPHFKAVLQEPDLSMAEAISGCTWPKDDDVNFQWGSTLDWVEHVRDDFELTLRRIEWQSFVENDLLPWEQYKDRFRGRGIVIVAGNGRSFKRVKVQLRALQRLGSRLPIEFNYWGDEMSDETKSEILRLWPNSYFNDLSAATNVIHSNSDLAFLPNYQLKTAAVLNSRFAEPLLLDSDNIPVIDPESLYESDVYQEYGTLFWPDIARTRPVNPAWAIFNTKCRMDEYEQESGQMIVDKSRFFYHLQLAAWLNNQHGDYYNEFLLGDKDMFRFAWHALRTKYGKPPKWLTTVGTLREDGFYCGHSFAQHHPDGRVAFLHGGTLKTIPKEAMAKHLRDRGGIWQAYKRAPMDEDHSKTIKVGLKWNTNDDVPDLPPDTSATWCTDFFDTPAHPFEELLPGFGKIFEEIGGYWLLEEEQSTW